MASRSDRTPLVQRLERFRLYPVDWTGTDCLGWSGAVHLGYGKMTVLSGELGVARPRMMLGHRVAWILANGPIAEGVVDHICHNDSGCAGGVSCLHRRCTNLAHLELVSLEENKRRGESRNAQNARKTHCKRGHEFTPENTRVRESGYRSCRACDRMFAEISNAAKREGK